MKKLSFALACAASAAVFAAGQANPILDSVGFESYAENFTGLSGKMDDGTAGQGPTDSHWLYVGSGDSSTVKTYGNDNLPVPAGSLSGEVGQKYLELSTEGGTLWRSINTLADATHMGTAQAVGTAGVYIDTMVQFTPTEDGGTPELGSDDKIAIWLNVDTQQNTTNLCVRASLVHDDNTATTCTPTTFVLNPADPTNPVKAGTWYRLTIKAIADVDQRMAKNPDAYTSGMTGFQIFLDGQLLSSSTAAFTAGYIGLATDAGEYGWLDQSTDAALITFLQSGSVFASLKEFETSATIQGIGFKGSGAIDDLVFKDENPFPAPADVDFTVTIPTGASATYAIGEGTPTALPQDGKISGAVGAAYTVTITLADGTVAVKMGTLAADGSADYSTVDWSFYLAGEGTAESPYVIPNLAELQDFQKGVAAGLATTGLYFQQTADIDMTSAGAWGGISEFSGVYDGGDFTVTNLTFAVAPSGKYTRGFFDKVLNGTVKNLKVHSLGYSSYSADYLCGGAILVATLQTSTLESCVTMGCLGTDAAPVTKNGGGMICMAGGGCLVTNCVNYADVVGSYGKQGGICCFLSTSAGGGTATFADCVNYGTIKSVTEYSGSDYAWTGGITSYNQTGLVIDNCANFGMLVCGGSQAEASKMFLGSFVGNAAGAITFSGTNTGCPDYRAVGNNAQLPFATVADNVATFCDAAAAGGSYKVMVDGQTVTLANVGDTVTLDETLASATVTTTSADGEVTHAGNVYTVAGYVAQVGAGKYLALADAVTAATAGDTIEILADIGTAGTLVDLALGKSLTLVAAAGKTPTIRNYNFLANGADSAIAVSNLTFAGTTVFRLQQCTSFTMENVTANVTPYRAKNCLDGHSGSTNKAHPAFIYLGANDSSEGFATTTPITVVLKNNTIVPANGATGDDAITGLNYNQYGNVIWGNRMVATGTKFEGNTFYSSTTPSTWGSIILMGSDPNGATVEIKNNVFYGTTTVYNYQPLDGKVLLAGSGATTWLSSGNQFNIDVVENPANTFGVFTIEQNNQARMAIIDDGTSTLNGNAITMANCADDSAKSGTLGFIMLNGVADANGKYTAGTLSHDLSAADKTALLAAGYETVADGDYFRITAASAGYPTYIAADDAAKKAKYDTWAASYGADTASAYEKAFLLNVDPTSAAAVAAAEAAFQITSITLNADGSATVVTAAGPDGTHTYNGTIVVKGCATLNGTYTTEAVTNKTAKFFKAFLE